MSRIYVVEDDENISALVAAVLSAAGHEVRAMESGALLEKQIDAGELPDLLLLDIMLPGKDGLTLLREWKARPSTAAIPCIILSAKGEELDKVRGLELGAEDYVTKPFGVLELQARVKTALRRVPAASGTVRLGDNEIDFARREVWRTLKQLKEQGLTIFLTTHYMEEAEALCDRVCIIKSGRKVSEGTIDEVIAAAEQKNLEDAYLFLMGEEELL